MAGPWLRFRGHLENISNNCLIGALNAFNDQTNSIKNQLDNQYNTVPNVAKDYKNHNIESLVVGGHNYGEGSSREHAAMEPRFLGVKIVLVKSFARIHETNLKKQGVLALTFLDELEYDKILEDDVIDIQNLKTFQPNQSIMLKFKHLDGSFDLIEAAHTYNENQIEWFKYGSALNKIKQDAL
jgi:aconitate hydratase